MNGYTKLFQSILASTIWRADDPTRIVWITMLALADRDGIVEASVPGLADFARVPLAACVTALQTLSAPDEWSRTRAHDGRRIEPVEGGWRLVNHAAYRAKLNADDRRNYLKLKQREYRARKRQQSTDVSTNVDNVSDTSRMLTQAEADTKEDLDPINKLDPNNKLTRSRARGNAPLHLSHKGHAHCGRVCLHGSLFSEFVRRRNHADADQEVRDWALAVEREWGPTGPKSDVEPGDAFDFWRARYAERWPAPLQSKDVPRSERWRPEEPS